MTGLISVENNLASYSLFSEPGYFQSLPMYPFLIMGTLQVTWWLWRWRSGAGRLLSTLLVINVLGWAVVWLPTLPRDFVKVSTPAAQVLSGILHDVPVTTEVVTSQGIFGRFAGRRYAHAFMGESAIPVYTRPVVFVIAPYQGINESAVSTELARVAYLEETLHAHLVQHTAGIWEFRWNPPAGTTGVDFPMALAHLPAWGRRATPGCLRPKGRSPIGT
jgi:hypothetical protein